MGLCCSTSLDPHGHSSSMAARRPRSPPPIMDDDSVVKEVLSVSETPMPKHVKVDDHDDGGGDQEHDDHLKSTKKRPAYAAALKPVFLPTPEEISEICSLNDSLSTNDTAPDFDSAARPFHTYTSPMKLPPQRSRSASAAAAARSPARRSENSPGRRLGGGGTSAAVRIVQPRAADSGRVGSRGGLGSDPGCRSARRSRSPAMRPAAVGRSPSARRSGRVNGSSEDPSWPAKRNTSNDESFDNPLVSMECFIFL